MSRTQSRTRRQRVEERELAIIAAARDAFIANGFDGARIAEIARNADVAEGTIYLYFENKNALLTAVLRQFYDDLTAGAAEGVDALGDTYERLQFLARHHLENVGRVWQIFALTNYRSQFADTYRDDGTYELNKTYVAVFDRVIREGINRREVRSDLRLGVLRDVFYGALEYIHRTALVHRRDPEKIPDRVIADFMAVIRQGLAGEQPAEAPGSFASIALRLEGTAERLERAASRLTRET